MVPYCPPVNNSGIRNIVNAPVAPNIVKVDIVGHTLGIIIWKNSCQFDAPSISAASKISLGILAIAPLNIRLLNPIPAQTLYKKIFN